MAVALDGCNPGGINDGAFAQTQHGYKGRNGRYAAFNTLADGVNAMRVLLTSYIRRGYDTPAKIIARYAPRADGNDEAAYAARVAKSMGIKPTNVIPLEKAMSLALAMAKVENPAFPALWAKEQEHV
jgi:hypothetical protein